MPFRKDLEAFKESDRVLVRDAAAGNIAVIELFFLAELVIFTGFYGMLRVGVKRFDSDITRIDFRSNPRCQSDAGGLEQREIMGFSIGKGCADHLPRGFVYHDLCFQCVPLFLP